MSAPYSTMIWVARVEGLQSHLRIIAAECEDSESRHVQRIGRQAKAGIEEAGRYLADRDWGDDGEGVAA